MKEKDIARIAVIQTEYLHERLSDRGMALVLTDAAKKRLAVDGFDPAYGARPLKRLIQKEIENPLARMILEGKYESGDTIVVDAQGETFRFAARESLQPVS